MYPISFFYFSLTFEDQVQDVYVSEKFKFFLVFAGRTISVLGITQCLNFLEMSTHYLAESACKTHACMQRILFSKKIGQLACIRSYEIFPQFVKISLKLTEARKFWKKTFVCFRSSFGVFILSFFSKTIDWNPTKLERKSRIETFKLNEGLKKFFLQLCSNIE